MGGLECSRKRVGSIQVEDWADAETHFKHLLHVCDAGGVPRGNVCVERMQAREEPAHACDC